MPFFKQETVADWLDNQISTAKITDSDSPNAALKDIAMYTAVGLIADLISGCEVQVFKEGQPVHDGDWYVFNVSANPNKSSQQVMSRWIIDYYYCDAGALLVPLSGNLYNAASFAIDPYPLKGDLFKTICIEDYQISRNFRADKVYYIKQDGPVSVKRLIDKAYADYATLLYYSKKMYVENSGEKYELQFGNYPSGDPQKQEEFLKKISDNMESFLNAESAVYPATKDQKLTRVSASNNTLSPSGYMSIRKDVYDIVASALHLPADLLEGNTTSIDQVLNQSLTMAIDPLAKKLSRELTRKTFKREEIMSGSRIDIDTTRIKHMDVVDMADKIDKLISSGVMCIDEVRGYCSLPKIGEEWAQTHYITKNYGEVDSLDPLEGGEKG